MKWVPGFQYEMCNYFNSSGLPDGYARPKNSINSEVGSGGGKNGQVEIKNSRIWNG